MWRFDGALCIAASRLRSAFVFLTTYAWWITGAAGTKWLKWRVGSKRVTWQSAREYTWHEAARLRAWCMGPDVTCAAHQSEPIRHDCVACSYRLTCGVAHARMELSQCGALVHERADLRAQGRARTSGFWYVHLEDQD
ncbi:hypothetical protein HanIR_Chr08g0356171 [Helianthus annuus]|nr:hypothetical protein HanIR_Chr08g0356171 [Helianthus annuus]